MKRTTSHRPSSLELDESLHPLVINQGYTTTVSVNFVSVGAQVDLPGERTQRVQKWFSTKSQARATEIVWKCQGPSGANAIGTLMRADAPDGSLDELNNDLSESRAESDSCLLSASKGEANIICWDECLFSNVDVATHGSYESHFLVIVNVENGKLFAYNNDQSGLPELESNGKHLEWLGMPEVGVLPNDVADITAGDGGFLCAYGGSQPGKRILHTPPIPHAEDYNHMLFPQQSILVVCNPLIEELKFLPRHTNKKLDDKIACLQILKSNDSSRLSEKVSKIRLRYRVHVAGDHHERSSLRCPVIDELILMTCDSRSDTWISGMAAGRSQIPAYAGQEEGFHLGGLGD